MSDLNDRLRRNIESRVNEVRLKEVEEQKKRNKLSEEHYNFIKTVRLEYNKVLKQVIEQLYSNYLFIINDKKNELKGLIEIEIENVLNNNLEKNSWAIPIPKLVTRSFLKRDIVQPLFLDIENIYELRELNIDIVKVNFENLLYQLENNILSILIEEIKSDLVDFTLYMHEGMYYNTVFNKYDIKYFLYGKKEISYLNYKTNSIEVFNRQSPKSLINKTIQVLNHSNMFPGFNFHHEIGCITQLKLKENPLSLNYTGKTIRTFFSKDIDLSSIILLINNKLKAEIEADRVNFEIKIKEREEEVKRIKNNNNKLEKENKKNKKVNIKIKDFFRKLSSEGHLEHYSNSQIMKNNKSLSDLELLPDSNSLTCTFRKEGYGSWVIYGEENDFQVYKLKNPLFSSSRYKYEGSFDIFRLESYFNREVFY